MSGAVTNLAELLVEAARRRPAATALRAGGRSTSYAELAEEARRQALALCAAGVTPGARVGLLGTKSAAIVAATQGVLRADAVYVPLDLRWPAERLTLIARDCGIETVVADAAGARHAAALAAAGVRQILPLEQLGEATDERAALPALPELRVMSRGGDDLAYILYTSGSTGRPKGVMLSHRNALTYVEWAHTYFGFAGDDRLLCHAPLTFDLPVSDLYNGFLAGATVVLLSEEDALFPAATVKRIAAEEITSLYMVPSAYVGLMNRGGLLATDAGRIRRILYSGEAFPIGPLVQLLSWAPGAHACNLYGPIETNACTYHTIDRLPVDVASIPIGRPIGDAEIALVDAEGREVAEGEVGELCVTGGCVTLGYWGDAQLTAAKKRVRGDGRTWFFTGDLARRGEGGALEFHGRRDYMIKTRGFRVELAEVEHALASHPGVAEVAVVALPDPGAGNLLYACFVARTGGVTARELQGHAGQRLAPYMVPSEIFEVAALPKTTSGKVSRLEVGKLVEERKAGRHGARG